jgi:hypothetical protein
MAVIEATTATMRSRSPAGRKLRQMEVKIGQAIVNAT